MWCDTGTTIAVFSPCGLLQQLMLCATHFAFDKHEVAVRVYISRSSLEFSILMTISASYSRYFPAFHLRLGINWLILILGRMTFPCKVHTLTMGFMVFMVKSRMRCGIHTTPTSNCSGILSLIFVVKPSSSGLGSWSVCGCKTVKSHLGHMNTSVCDLCSGGGAWDWGICCVVSDCRGCAWP